MMALKSFLMNEIYDLRQQLAQIQLQEKQDQTHNGRLIKELEMKLQYFQKENQTLRDENISKRIEAVLNQNNELLKISQPLTNNRKNSTQGILRHQSAKSDVFQKSGKNTSNKSFSNNFDTIISPNHFETLFNEEVNYNAVDIDINNNHCDDLVDKGIDRHNTVRKKNNETKKNLRRPFLVVNQDPENQTTFGNTSHRIGPGGKSYSEALINNSKSDGQNIKIFCDKIPKGIRIKELNQHINNGNAQLHSSTKRSTTGATSEQLLHYLDFNLDNSTDSVLIHTGISEILNSISNVNRLLLNIKDKVKKCRNFVDKDIFVSGLVYTERIKIEILEDLHKKLVSLCREIQAHFIDNRNICGFNLFKAGLHLLN